MLNIDEPTSQTDACFAGGQSYLLNLWHGAKYKDSIVQGMQFMRAIGSVVAPFLVEPFLVPLHDTNAASHTAQNDTIGLNMTSPGVDYKESATTVSMTAGISSASISDLISMNISGEVETLGSAPADIHKLSYGFLISGIIGYLGTLLFCVAANRPRRCSQSKKREDNESSSKSSGMDSSNSPEETKEGKIYRTVMFALFFLSFMSYQWIESIPGFFVAAFVVEGLGWDITMGSLITTVFWGAHTFGLFLGIGLSWRLSPQTMIIISLVMTTASVIILTLFVHIPIVVWVTIGTAGVSMSTIFGSNLLLASRYINVSGLAAAIFLFGSSVGYMTCYPLTGYLFQTYSHMWMAYLTLISCGTSVFLFVGLSIFHSVYTRIKPSAIQGNRLEMEPMRLETGEIT